MSFLTEDGSEDSFEPARILVQMVADQLGATGWDDWVEDGYWHVNMLAFMFTAPVNSNGPDLGAVSLGLAHLADARAYLLKPSVPDGFKHSLLIDALMPSDIACDVQLNLAEVYPIWVERHGPSRARWIHRFQIARLILGQWGNRIVELAERLLKVTRIVGS